MKYWLQIFTQLTKKAADDYMDLVANRLNDMHEVALKEMVAEVSYWYWPVPP